MSKKKALQAELPGVSIVVNEDLDVRLTQGAGWLIDPESNTLEVYAAITDPAGPATLLATFREWKYIFKG